MSRTITVLILLLCLITLPSLRVLSHLKFIVLVRIRRSLVWFGFTNRKLKPKQQTTSQCTLHIFGRESCKWGRTLRHIHIRVGPQTKLAFVHGGSRHLRESKPAECRVDLITCLDKAV